MGPDKVTRSVERPLSARLRSAAYAAMAYWYYEWDWGEAIAYDGIDETAMALDDEHLRAFVDAGVERWAALEPAASLANRMGPVSRALQRLNAGEAKWRHLEAPIEAFCEAVVEAPRSVRGAFLLDKPSPLIFVDTLYAEPAALAALGSATGRDDLIAAAIELCLGHTRHLQDDRTGLFRHYCDTDSGASPSILWGRGNGWALLGLAETLASLGAAEPSGVVEVRSSFSRACGAAVEAMVPGGGWRNIVDDDASSPEASTSAMIATALFIGVRSGVLEAAKFLPVAEETWRVLAHRVDAGGHFMGVSFRPGLNSDPARYEHVPFAGNLPWGQGSYLRLGAERLRHENDL